MTAAGGTVRAIAACLVGLAAAPLAAQEGGSRIVADVRYLASDALEGRGVGTAGLDSAARYLALRFRELGLAPAGTDGYLQAFELDPSAPAVAHQGIGRASVANVVGLLPGRGALAGQAVVLGAHYDHLGLGGLGSLDPDSLGVVHNGADDNASGTAALLETARLLASRGGARRTFVFVAFTAEELGLIGSEYYVTHPAVPNASVYAMLNFDMVGRLRGDSLHVIGAGSATELAHIVEAVNATHRLALTVVGDPWGRSDHSSFYARRVPVVHLFTNTHEDYHRTTDDVDKLNAAGIARVARFAADLAWTLATRTEPLTFVDVPAPAPAGGGGYGAYLGTVPDMAGSPGGVRLTGVRRDSPAERAGLRAGDILVQIGDHVVADLYAMTDALRALRPGDTVTITFLRDGARHEVRVTLGRRGG